MVGANIFVMYTSSDGNNVTVSPRYASSYSEPQYDSTAQITLLEGSGVSGGKMVANVRCSNCQSWNGGQGTMDFSGSTADFIYAAKSGAPINSDSPEAGISEHDVKSAFSWTISNAKGGSENVNPFVVSSGGSSSGGTPTTTGSSSATGGASIPASCTPIADSVGTLTPSTTLAGPSGSGCPTTFPTPFPTGNPPAWVKECFPGAGQGSYPTGPPSVKAKRDDGCPAGYASTSSSISNDGVGLSASQQQTLMLAHGVLACLAFVVLFPAGGILIRIANFTGLVWIHAGLQMVGYLVYIVAFAMGVYLATHLNYMSRAHPIIGIALLVVLFFQPILGFLHHRMFKRSGRRTLWSYAHLFHGRFAILLGMVNGGLGIQLANTASSAARIAYAIIVAVIAVIYIAAVVKGEMQRRRDGPPAYEKSQRAHQLRDLSGSESELAPVRPSISKPQPMQQQYEIPAPHRDYYARGNDNRF